MTDEPLLPGDVKRALHTRLMGHRLFYYPETDSTNDAAAALARRGEPEGTVVYADFQRRGRGRLDHTWFATPGCDLAFSVVLRPDATPREVLPVTLAASLALAVVLGKATGADVGVKWPNDLVTPSGEPEKLAKLAGILAESAADRKGCRFVVVGVGVNVNSALADFPESLHGRAVSCLSLSGAPHDRAALLGDVLSCLEAYYERFCADGFAPLVSSYEERLVLRGRRVHFQREGRRVNAEVVGVSRDGALRVVADGAETNLYGESVEVVQ